MLSAGGMDAFTIVSCKMSSDAAKEEFAILETELEEELRSTDQSPAQKDQTRAKRKRSHVRESCFSQQVAENRATMILLPPDSIDRFSRVEAPMSAARIVRLACCSLSEGFLAEFRGYPPALAKRV